MDRIFIPTSTLNFNNIFSSESISPQIFYELRKFGYKRFSLVGANPFTNSLLGYSKIPNFTTDDKESDNYPMYIEVPVTELKQGHKIFNENGIRIYQFNHTVYLNPFITKIYFKNLKQKQITITKSEQSYETKLVNVYRDTFNDLESLEIETFTLDNRLIQKIEDDNFVNNSGIDFDYKFNKIKGFIYSFILGGILTRPPEFVELQIQVRELRNIISGLFTTFNMSLSKNKKTQKPKLGYIDKPIYKGIWDRINELKIIINKIQILYKPYNISENQIIQHYFNQYEKQFPIDELIKLLKEVPSKKRSLYLYLLNNSELKDDLRKIRTLPDLFTQLFDWNKSEFITEKQNPLEYVDKIISDFDKILANLDFKLTDKSSAFDTRNFVIENSLNISYINNLEVENIEDYLTILTMLLKVKSVNQEEFKIRKADLIFEIGIKLKESNLDWEKSSKRDYFNSLMVYLESYQSSFQITSEKSIVWQSLAAFSIKGDDFEKLFDFLIKNRFIRLDIPMGLWGAYFGFASIPRTVTKALYEGSDLNYLKSVYNFFSDKINNTSWSIMNPAKTDTLGELEVPIQSTNKIDSVLISIPTQNAIETPENIPEVESLSLLDDFDFVDHLLEKIHSKKIKPWPNEYNDFVIEVWRNCEKKSINSLPYGLDVKASLYEILKMFIKKIKKDNPDGFSERIQDHVKDAAQEVIDSLA